MMQVVSKLRLATEHSNAVIGIIAYQPLIQIVPIGRQVHVGVLLCFRYHDLFDGYAVEQFRHFPQGGIICRFMDETYGNTRSCLQQPG